MSAQEIPDTLHDEMCRVAAEHALDLTNPNDVVKLSTDMVAMMWDVPRENVRVDHAVILNDVLHLRGAVRAKAETSWVTISIGTEE